MKNLYKQFLFIFTFLISSFGLKAQISGPTAICQNSSVNYSCSAAATYNWSVSPSGAETISNPSIQNPDISFSAAGNYTITVNTTSPVNTFTLGISTDEIPNPPGTTGVTYCLNSWPVPLIAAPSSGGVLTWYTTPIGGIGSITPPVPNTSSVGITSYYVSETNGVCESSRSQIDVVVFPLPTINISSNSPVCENGTINLMATGDLGSTFAWVGPNGFISTAQSPSITNATVLECGTYTVSATDNGCSIIDSISFIVNPLPIINTSNNSPICENGTLNLMASGGISYSWSGPNVFNSNVQNPTIANATFFMAGNYTVTVADANGCMNANVTVVTIQPGSFLSGTALSNSTPITAGQVILYTPIQGTTYYDTIATTNLNASGQYSFTSVPAGDYIIKCIPDSTTYPTLIETYYGDVAAWYLADTIYHDCISNSVADIHVIEPILMPGPGTISGTIIEGFGFGSRLINSNTEVQVPGGPLKDIDVNLVSLPSNTVVAQTTSDFNGYYEFSNVAVGDYTLQVDILGLPMDSSYYIIIDPLLFSTNVNQTTSSVFTNLDFVADNTAIYITNSIGIKQNENNVNGISIYPNPAKNTINIKLQSGDKINGQIEIIDNLGKTVASQNLNSELTQINIETLTTGFYFVKVKSEKGINTFRFIKQ